MLAIAALGAITLVVLGQVLGGSIPPMSLVPELPADATAIANDTEYTEGAGGIGSRNLLLVSSNRPPDELLEAVATSFDADERWHRSPNGFDDSEEWCTQAIRHDDGTQERTSATVSIVEAGELIPIGQFDGTVVPERSVLVKVHTAYHVFADVGAVIGPDVGDDAAGAHPCDPAR